LNISPSVADRFPFEHLLITTLSGNNSGNFLTIIFMVPIYNIVSIAISDQIGNEPPRRNKTGICLSVSHKVEVIHTSGIKIV
jgi:hypothetical protein